MNMNYLKKPWLSQMVSNAKRDVEGRVLLPKYMQEGDFHLSLMFMWQNTPQGGVYWARIMGEMYT